VIPALSIASIPSPSTSAIDIGPLVIHIYGLLIGIGVVLAAVVTQRRYERFGGDPTIVDRIVVWIVLIGFLGARLAYVSTHTQRYAGRWYAVLFIWEGGLALFGGLTAGAIAAIWILRRERGDVAAFADAAAVGIPLAQAIGRWGNYFNQELFGTPTTLPWGLEIDVAHRPAAYLSSATFHPTFLYESLWNLLVTIPLILLLERRGKLARGSAIGVYLIVYGVIRFLTELIRTDTSFRLAGLSRNAYVAIAGMILGAIIVRWRQRAAPANPHEPTPIT